MKSRVLYLVLLGFVCLRSPAQEFGYSNVMFWNNLSYYIPSHTALRNKVDFVASGSLYDRKEYYGSTVNFYFDKEICKEKGGFNLNYTHAWPMEYFQTDELNINFSRKFGTGEDVIAVGIGGGMYMNSIEEQSAFINEDDNAFTYQLSAGLSYKRKSFDAGIGLRYYPVDYSILGSTNDQLRVYYFDNLISYLGYEWSVFGPITLKPQIMMTIWDHQRLHQAWLVSSNLILGFRGIFWAGITYNSYEQVSFIAYTAGIKFLDRFSLSYANRQENWSPYYPNIYARNEIALTLNIPSKAD